MKVGNSILELFLYYYKLIFFEGDSNTLIFTNYFSSIKVFTLVKVLKLFHPKLSCNKIAL